jgi:hypothetical protein
VTPAELAADAIRARLGAATPDLYLGPDGDYLLLTRGSPWSVQVSVSCAGLPAGWYSVQVCWDHDPLAIVFDDECDLAELVGVCEAYLGE